MQSDDKLDFVVNVTGSAWIREILTLRQEVVRVFLEEERRLLIRIVTHLHGMAGEVAPDAVDAMNGEKRITSSDRKAWVRGGLEKVRALLRSLSTSCSFCSFLFRQFHRDGKAGQSAECP
ncbi:hypothetical protein ABID21_003037 [Pseudorhizobium tarimense]|uniref:Uncharacterized protein n=1 Tax=Pseudorhizobium tarimense TaxID=1079109 RepID=A0ABV2H8P7_9HYPH